jgi:hypothetical protein
MVMLVLLCIENVVVVHVAGVESLPRPPVVGSGKWPTAVLPRMAFSADVHEWSIPTAFAFGIATLGSLGTAVYHAELATTLPANLPFEVNGVIRDTLATAVATRPRCQTASAQLWPRFHVRPS